jgi:hypothetical protein
VLNTILIITGLVLLGLKFGLRARLRELGRALDRLVNIVLVAIVVIYCLQLTIMFLTRR